MHRWFDPSVLLDKLHRSFAYDRHLRGHLWGEHWYCSETDAQLGPVFSRYLTRVRLDTSAIMPSSMDYNDEASEAAAGPSTLPPSYRFFLGDAQGQMKVWRAPYSAVPLPPTEHGPLPEIVQLGGSSAKLPDESAAVQKMAAGVIEKVGWVVAIARRNATIDVVMPSEDGSAAAVLIGTIKNDKMKAGLQRWVGLAIGKQGIYAATSAGDFTFSAVRKTLESSSASGATAYEVEVAHRLALPEPLQAVAFYPSTDPSHFLYGGEEIPLSIWHIETALSPPTSSGEEGKGSVGNGNAAEGEEYIAPEGELATPQAGAAGENAKMRKRKRQAEAKAKARELLWGEVWRAKNLPNDALSLPRRPNITSVAVVAANGRSDDADDGHESESPSVPDWTVAVGTRDGLVRVFEPSTGVRKHTKEIRVVPEGQTGAMRFVCSGIAGTNDGEIVAADSTGRFAAVAFSQGKLRYQWKDITGAVSTAFALPAPRRTASKEHTEKNEDRADLSSVLFSSSLDRLLRLHSFPASESAQGKSHEPTSSRGQNLVSAFTGGAAVTAAVWDGVVPELASTSEDVQDESMRRADREDGGASDDEAGDGEDEEQVWQAMQEVGEGEENKRRSVRINGNRRSSGFDEDQADVQQVEAVKEDRSKRTKK